MRTFFLVIFFITGCSTNKNYGEHVDIRSPYSQSIVKDIVSVLVDNYDRNTVFKMIGKGNISIQVEDSLRANGFAVSPSDGIYTRLIIDDFYDKTIFVSILLDDDRMTRVYIKRPDFYEAQSPWTHYKN